MSRTVLLQCRTLWSRYRTTVLLAITTNTRYTDRFGYLRVSERLLRPTICYNRSEKVCSSYECPDYYSPVDGNTVCKDSKCSKDICCEKDGKTLDRRQPLP